MRIILYVSVLLIVTTSCTISWNIVHTSGLASDLIDEQQKANPTVDFKIPAFQ